MAMERCDIHYQEAPVKGILQHTGLLLQRLGERVTRWGQLAEQRRLLRELDDHMLKDIGLSRADVDRIAGHRWFWDDPKRSGEVVDQRYRRPGR